MILASEEVMCKLIGEQNPAKAQEFLCTFVKSEQNQYSYTNCYVAFEEDVIIGSILVYDGERLQELRKQVLDHIHANFDPEVDVEDETQAGEYYIASMAYRPCIKAKELVHNFFSLSFKKRLFPKAKP